MPRAVSEAQLVADVLLACGRGDTRLWRFNAGVSWAGTIVRRTSTHLTLMNYHPVRLAPEGFPDTAGFTSIVVTPEMIGTRIAQFLGVETKFGRNRPTETQAAFLEMARSLGARAGVAYSVEDALKIITL